MERSCQNNRNPHTGISEGIPEALWNACGETAMKRSRRNPDLRVRSLAPTRKYRCRRPKSGVGVRIPGVRRLTGGDQLLVLLPVDHSLVHQCGLHQAL